MNNEFKKIESSDYTRYVLENAGSGGTSSGSIASMDTPLGKDQIVVQSRMGQPTAPKPRNFVAKNAKTGGAGAHKDKKKAEKQGDVKHKNKDMAEGSTDLVQIEYWQQDTMESGRWIKTKPIPRATAEKIVNSFERGEIVDVEQGVAEGSEGFSIEDMVMDQYRNGNEVWEIASNMGMSEDEVQDIINDGEQGVSEGSLNEGQYEMMMRNGQVKKFIAKDDADAKRIAAGHGAKSVIKLRGGLPAGKVSEQGVAEGLNEDEYDKYEAGVMDESEAVAKMFTRLARQGRDPLDIIANRFGWGTYELDDLAQEHGFEDSAEWLNSFQGVAEAEKNPHTSALGKALYRDLSKEKKASPAQVQRNKERWAQRQADKEQGVAEGGFPKKVSKKEVDKFQKKNNDKLTGREVNRQEQEKKPANNQQGVAEGLNDTQKKIEDTINKLEDRLKHAKSDEQWDRISARIERLQAGLNRSKQGVAAANLSELNTDTVYSYAKKAHKDQDKQSTITGKAYLDNDPKTANKAHHKFSMRAAGLDRAEKRLNKEGVAEGLSKRDQQDVAAIRAAIARLEAQLNHPNADRDAIQQSIAHEKKRLALYGVTEGLRARLAELKQKLSDGALGSAASAAMKSPAVHAAATHTLKYAGEKAVDAIANKLSKRAKNKDSDDEYSDKLAEMLELKLAEKIPQGADVDYYIKDFAKSSAPQFRGKTPEKKKQMAIAAYYGSKQPKKKKK